MEFLAQTEEDLAAIREAFDEYQKNTGRNFEELKLRIAFRKETTPIERQLFLMKMETQLNYLKTEVTHYKAMLSMSEENRELLARLVEASRSPNLLIQPLRMSPQRRPYQSELSVLHADLTNFTSTVTRNPAFRLTLQTWLAEVQAEFRTQPACEQIKNQGDGFLALSTDSLWLFEMAQQLGHRLDQFKLRNPSPLGGFRFVLARGQVNCAESEGVKEFDGDAIIECSRIDQPMKRYLNERGITVSQMWCTELFKDDIEPRSPHLRFAELPAIPLDKDYESTSRLYQISIA